MLNEIDCPDDIKCATYEELDQLAEEIRKFLVEKLSVTGGHLAPNLGVVELTLALHYLFDSPRDKIIWDVGHQSYVHKILTGRVAGFDSLRQFGGLGGFPKLSESEHDVFETGHSSTSISSAIGFALARDLKGDDHRVIAVIGDGALTGGMAFEAMNYLGYKKNKMIIILNDNKMSISQNVGGVHNYLEKLRTNQGYLRAKKKFRDFTKKIPLGEGIFNFSQKIRDSLKYLVVEGILFEEIGLTYLGPVDGHDIPSLIEILENADKLDEPVLVHVLTEKGRGFQPAEFSPDVFHGIGRYDINSGELIQTGSTPNYTSIFADTLVKLAATNEEIVAITAAMPAGTGLDKFQEAYPERFFDVGIAEQHAVTMAAGMALAGFIPVVAIYSTFLQRAYDQVLHDAARQNAHVIFAIDRAGLVGADGDTHHGIFDIAYLRSIPNMTIMMPKDERELQNMLYTAMSCCSGPVVVRYPRANGFGIPLSDEYEEIEIGSFETIRAGEQVAILALGPMLELAKKAAEELTSEGINTQVVNARFIKPLDEKYLLELAAAGFKILTVEEGVKYGGFGASLLEFYSSQELSVTVECIGIADEFVTHGNTDRLREHVGLTVENIVDKVKNLIKKDR